MSNDTNEYNERGYSIDILIIMRTYERSVTSVLYLNLLAELVGKLDLCA